MWEVRLLYLSSPQELLCRLNYYLQQRWMLEIEGGFYAGGCTELEEDVTLEWLVTGG